MPKWAYGVGEAAAGATLLAIPATSAAGVFLLHHGLTSAVATSLITAGAGSTLGGIATMPSSKEQRPFEILFGTLHFVVVGKRRLIACSDGRATSFEGTTSGSYIKVHKAGQHTLVGTVGMINIGQPISADNLVSSQVADICSRASLQDRPDELLSVIRDEFQPAIDEVQRLGSWDYSFRKFPESIVAFQALVVSRLPGGRIDIITLLFPLMTGTEGDRYPGEPQLNVLKRGYLPVDPFYFFAGVGIPPDAILPNPDEDLSDSEVLSRVDGVFALAEQLTPLVGPPYDVALIDDSGFRWVRRQAGEENRPSEELVDGGAVRESAAVAMQAARCSRSRR